MGNAPCASSKDTVAHRGYKRLFITEQGPVARYGMQLGMPVGEGGLWASVSALHCYFSHASCGRDESGFSAKGRRTCQSVRSNV